MTWIGRPTGPHSIGWLTSVCLHAALAVGALAVTQRMTLAPQPAPFTWSVAMVNTPSQPPRSSAAPPTTIDTRLTKTPLPPTSAPASTVPNGTIGERATSAEQLIPPSEEAMVRRHETSPILDNPQDVETTEPQQAVDQIAAPREAVTSPPELSGREQMPSGLNSTTASQLQESSLPVPMPSPLAVTVPGPDYAWLSETIMRRMQELKRYPAEARLDRAEGKVVLKAVIRSNGSLEVVEVFQTSGHKILDRAAVELLTQAAPFHFPRPLEKPQMTMKIPMNYRLDP